MHLEFSHLSMSYRRKEVLHDISVELTEGVYGLLGPNGAGKTTLMNILAGNLYQTQGNIFYNGQDIRDLGKVFRSQLGYMPQQQGLFPAFSVERFMFYMAALHGLDKKIATRRIDELLSLLELSHMRHKPIRTLSGGMKQRLLLAQAILADPEILLLDEPTAGLDPKQRIAVRNLIAEISQRKIVIISTHVVQDVECIAKELLMLSSGRLLHKGCPSKLVEQLKGSVWSVEADEGDLPRIREQGIVCSMIRQKNNITVRLLADQAPSFPCRPEVPDLEDVYLNFFHREEKL